MSIAIAPNADERPRWTLRRPMSVLSRSSNPEGRLNARHKPLLMRWTAPHKASKCRRVIVDDESPERAVHECNYHDRDRPCKEGVPNPRRRCREQACRCPEAQTQGGVGVLRQAGAVFGWHGGLRQCA